MQGQHREYKQNADKQLEESAAALRDIQTQMQSLQNQLNSAKEARGEAELKAEQTVTQAMNNMSHHQVCQADPGLYCARATMRSWKYVPTLTAQ